MITFSDFKDDQLVKLATAATLINCSRQKMYADVAAKTGAPHYRLGNRIFFKIKDLRNHIESARVEPGV